MTVRTAEIPTLQTALVLPTGEPAPPLACFRHEAAQGRGTLRTLTAARQGGDMEGRFIGRFRREDGATPGASADPWIRALDDLFPKLELTQLLAKLPRGVSARSRLRPATWSPAALRTACRAFDLAVLAALDRARIDEDAELQKRSLWFQLGWFRGTAGGALQSPFRHREFPLPALDAAAHALAAPLAPWASGLDDLALVFKIPTRTAHDRLRVVAERARTGGAPRRQRAASRPSREASGAATARPSA